MKAQRILLACVATVSLSSVVRAQQLGFPPFGSFQDGGFDAVNRQNLNVITTYPIINIPGRGQSFSVSVNHNSLVWKRNGSYWVPATGYGWRGAPQTSGVVTFKTQYFQCDAPEVFEYTYHFYDFVYTDEMGTSYPFSLDFYEFPTTCNFPTGPRTEQQGGYFIDASSPWSPKVKQPDGVEIGVGSSVDRNGNYFSKIPSGSETHWKDTAGRLVLKVKPLTGVTEYHVKDQTASGYSVYKVHYQTKSIKTNFGCAGTIEYNASWSLPWKIELPTGKFYLIEYEQTPNVSGTYYTGRITKVTLPTGGSYEYIYPTAPGQNNGINCSDGTVKRLTRKITEGTNVSTWEYTRVFNSPNWELTVTDPAASDTVHTFGAATSVKSYSGSATSGTLLRTVNTTWSGGKPASTTVIVPDGANTKQSKTETTFDTYNNLTQMIEYDWGTNAPASSPTRTTQITYLSTSPYTTRNIRNLPTQILVRDGGVSGAIKSRTDIAYDEASYSNTECPTGQPNHNDSGYGCTFYTRGNPTTVTTYKNAAAGTGAVARHTWYDFFGNVRKAEVNCCQLEEWVYTATTAYAHPEQVKRGPVGSQLTTSTAWIFNTAQVDTVTDENNQVTNFDYDALTQRVLSVTRPDSTQATYTYNDTDRTAVVDTPVQGTDKIRQKTYFDTLGRPSVTEISNAAGGDCTATKTLYDALGRPHKSSNPYQCGGSPTYWTETVFDALGRVSANKAQDNSQTTFTYAGIIVEVTDPTGKKRKSESDALGRLKNVWEPDPANGNALTVLTSYAYNVLDRLTQVTQGVQTRTYQYDDLGRVTQETTPERGTWSYTYNDFNLLTQRTDARGVETNYTYDSLNRPYTDSYDVSGTSVPATSTVTYAYGTSTAAYENGRLKTVTDGVGSEEYFYNSLGQVTRVKKNISGTIYDIYYQYNLAGQITSITYPSGRVVTQTYDSIGRLTEIQGTYNSVTSKYVNNFQYDATSGTLNAFKYGDNAVSAAFSYSADRLQATGLSYTKVGQGSAFFSLTYGYGSAGSNNGQIVSITDNVEAGRTVAYTYDALHRLRTALTTGSATYPQWGLSWTYDRYGNRDAQTQTHGSPPAHDPAIDPYTNRIVPDANHIYDANGNMTKDGLNTLTYDAENRVVSAPNGAYVYDGGSLRVKKCAPDCTSPTITTIYLFSGTKVLAEYESGTLKKEYVYSGSNLVATHDNSALKFSHPDHLSTRATTDSSGNVIAQSGHYPYGESWYESGGANKLKFASYERDSETGNDYAVFRFYISRSGRFCSADPVAGSTSDPQSLNRYSYVRTDPLNLTDPLGLTYACMPVCYPIYDGGTRCEIMCFQFWSFYREPDWFQFLLYDVGPAPQIPPPPQGPSADRPVYIDESVLDDCVQQLFGVTLLDFKVSTPGGRGYFAGQGRDSLTGGGNRATILVQNDAATYTSAELNERYGPAPPGGTIAGFTPNANPYGNLTNNNNNYWGTAVTQVHELGHSLRHITTGVPDTEDAGYGQMLEDCVRNRRGFRRR